MPAGQNKGSEMKTVGISPKVWAPAALQFLALVVNFIIVGAFDRVSIAQAVGLAFTLVVGYLAGPGTVLPVESGYVDADVPPA